MNLPKPKGSAEPLASRLKEKHLLEDGVHVPFYLSRHKKLFFFSSQKRKSWFILNMSVRPTKWSLFRDSSKSSLKNALLHNKNLRGSVPLGHSTTLKENYKEIKIFFKKLRIMIIKGSYALTERLNFLLDSNLRIPNTYFFCMWDRKSRPLEKLWLYVYIESKIFSKTFSWKR